MTPTTPVEAESRDLGSLDLTQAITIVERRIAVVENSARAFREGKERHGYGSTAKDEWHRAQGDDIERQATANDIEAAAYRTVLAALPPTPTGGGEADLTGAFEAGWFAHETGYSASANGCAEALSVWLKGGVDFSDDDEGDPS